MAVTVPRVDPFGTPINVYRERSPYDASAFQTDPQADLFLSSGAPYLPPQAVCQDFSPGPTCNYQRPYPVYDEVHGGAFDISPDYMKNLDPRYNTALRNGE